MWCHICYNKACTEYIDNIWHKYTIKHKKEEKQGKKKSRGRNAIKKKIDEKM